MFKLDVMNKITKIIREIFKENPELYTFSDSTNVVEYFKYIIPLLRIKLSSEELIVLIEMLCLELTGTYNDMYYKAKNFYDSVILFNIDPEIAIIKFGGFDEIKGFDSFKA